MKVRGRGKPAVFKTVLGRGGDPPMKRRSGEMGRDGENVIGKGGKTTGFANWLNFLGRGKDRQVRKIPDETPGKGVESSRIGGKKYASEKKTL